MDSNDHHESPAAAKVIGVGISNGKNSQFALKWAVENLLKDEGSVVLVLVHVRTTHVNHRSSSESAVVLVPDKVTGETEMHELFLPYRGFCARKGIDAKEVVIHDIDVVDGLNGYIKSNLVGSMVVGSSSRNALTRKFWQPDVPSSLAKSAPEFCGIYVISSKGKLHTVLGKSKSKSKSKNHDHNHNNTSISVRTRKGSDSDSDSGCSSSKSSPRHNNSSSRRRHHHHLPLMNRVLMSQHNNNSKSSDHSDQDNEYTTGSSSTASPRRSQSSWASSEGSWTNIVPNTDHHQLLLQFESGSFSDVETYSLGSSMMSSTSTSTSSSSSSSSSSASSGSVRFIISRSSSSKPHSHRYVDDVNADSPSPSPRRKIASGRKLHAIAIANSAINNNNNNNIRNVMRCKQKYNFNEIKSATDNFSDTLKIGEGGYGSVYKATLEHTPVAIKVLRSDDDDNNNNQTEGLKQFQNEIEVLSQLNHPNIVLLLGACPEHGCLVYEHMDNGSLEDRLFRHNTPNITIPWRVRFKIAVDIATGLLFLHQSKPKPIVHRDLKPGNILLDRSYNAKISDVGLARLIVNPQGQGQVDFNVVMSAAVGTFFYIDPEYQQTGILSVMSDVYALGVVFLQMITARPPMGLKYLVDQAIEDGTTSDRLRNLIDPTVLDWPLHLVLEFARIAVRCCEIRKRDRPDLATEILPLLIRLRDQ